MTVPDVLVAVYTDQHYSLYHTYNEEAGVCFRRLHHCLVHASDVLYLSLKTVSLALPRRVKGLYRVGGRTSNLDL